MPTTTEEFNKKIAELLKQASTEEITEILKAEDSLIRTQHNNNNQNGTTNS